MFISEQCALQNESIFPNTSIKRHQTTGSDASEICCWRLLFLVVLLGQGQVCIGFEVELGCVCACSMLDERNAQREQEEFRRKMAESAVDVDALFAGVGGGEFEDDGAV